MNADRRLFPMLLLLAAIAIPLELRGQTVTATLTGTITDPSGAVVPGVMVNAMNQGTQFRYTAEATDAGVYRIPFLPPGTYVVEAELSGFKKAVTNPIRLEVNQTARVDLTLEIGELSDTVSVNGLSPILQSENAEIGQVISGSTTVSLPLNGRNFAQLTLLVPGAVTPNPISFIGGTRYGSGGRPYINGNREQGNSFLLDGISTDETMDNRIGYGPNVDAIAEFKIETNNASAEFGNVAAAIVNITTKSGTNDFHGNVFEFFRNEALDANSWSNNRSQAPKNMLRLNIYGGTFGGPLAPNRAFFFAAYQGARAHTGSGATAAVAPAAWRVGNLSSLKQTIIDSQTGKPFKGNILPESRIVNPAAKKLFSDTRLYPLPNSNVSGVVGNYASSTLTTTNIDQWDLKIDAKLTRKDSLSGRFSQGWYNQSPVRGILPVIPTQVTDAPVWNFALNWNRTFSARMVNEARFGVQRTAVRNNPHDWGGLGAANAAFGIPGGQPINGLSAIALGDGLTSIGTAGVVEVSGINTFHYGDNLTFSSGRHFMKAGFQLQRYQQNRFSPIGGLLGAFSYDGLFSGSAFADFLLDQLRSESRGSQTGTWGHRQNRIGMFFQDDFKVRRNLTWNIGMRWEYDSPLVEVKDRQVNYDPVTGRQMFAGKDGNSRALYEPYYRGFEPRIGFAWNPIGSLVLRAGYGIVQFMEGTGAGLRLPMNPPFFFYWSAPYDKSTGPGTITTGFAGMVPQDQVAGIINIYSKDLRPQFTEQWNFSIEWQLTGTATVTVAYVAHKATHLVNPRDFNQALPGTGPVSTWLPTQQRRPLYASLPLVTRVGGTESSATSDYHSLQVNGRKRYSRGLELLLSYTLSKTITDSLGFYGSVGVDAMSAYWINSYNRKGDRGLAFFDNRRNLVWSTTYDLPFGEGRRWVSGMSGIANTFLDGWTISSIVQLRSGFPITVVANDVSRQDSRGGGRPNRIASGKLPEPTLDKWLDIAAFVMPPDGQFGNAGVSINTAPGFANWDFAIGKKLDVTDRKYIDFRAEFFNVTNHPNFAPPARNFSVPSTFGMITNIISVPRMIEFVLKFCF
jgi:hypothetical protein